jgi:hypothetical protein
MFASGVKGVMGCDVCEVSEVCSAVSLYVVSPSLSLSITSQSSHGGCTGTYKSIFLHTAPPLCTFSYRPCISCVAEVSAYHGLSGLVACQAHGQEVVSR